MSSKISELPAIVAANLLDVDVVPVVSVGVTNKVAISDLRAKLGLVVPAGRAVLGPAYVANNATFNVLDYNVSGLVINTGLNPTQAKAAIVAADAAAAAVVHGGRVMFAPGIYAFSGDLIPSPGVEWVFGGKRQYAVKLKAADATARVLIKDSFRANAVVVEGSVTVPGSYVGIGVQIADTDFAGHIVLNDWLVTNFQTGWRLAGALWTTLNNCQAELNRVGWDWNAGSATLYSNAVVFNGCTAMSNERQGMAATYQPVGNSSIFWIGNGSVENNGASAPATYPQFTLGNCQHFRVETYFEYGLGGTKPDAIDARLMSQGKIHAIVFGSFNGILGDATSVNISITNSRFVNTANKCLNMPGAVQCREEANSFDLAVTTNVLPAYTEHNDVLFTDASYDIGKSFATRPRDGFFSRNMVLGGTLKVNGVTSLYGPTMQDKQSTVVSAAPAADVFRWLSDVGAVLNTSLSGRLYLVAIDQANGANQTQYVYDVTSAANLVGDAVLTQISRHLRGTDPGVSATPFALANDGGGGAVKLQFTKNAAIANVRVEAMFHGISTT